MWITMGGKSEFLSWFPSYKKASEPLQMLNIRITQFQEAEIHDAQLILPKK